MSEQQKPAESSVAPDGATPKPSLVPETPGEAVSASAVDALNKDEDIAGRVDQEDYRREQRYTRPFISFDRSSAGDVAAGNVYKTVYNYDGAGYRTKVFVDPVSARDLSRVQLTYVQTAAFADALRLLHQRRVLVLWGDAAAGKATTALRLLIERHAAAVRLDPAVDPNLLREHEFKAEYACLIDTLEPEGASKLSAFALNTLSSQLAKAQSYMVITVDNRVTLAREVLRDFAVAWRDSPPAEKVLRNHLDWHIPIHNADARERAYQLCADPRVRDILSNNPTLRVVCDLAAMLTRVVDGELDLEQAMSQLSAFALAQVQEWFERPGRSLDEHCLMIALSVLSGAQQQDVWDAEARLRQMLSPSDGAKQAADPTQMLFSSTKSKLKAVGASQRRVVERTNVGTTEVMVVEFDNPSFQAAVLEHVWHEYDRLHSLLLTWLLQLGQHANEDVRGRAAAAVGWIGRYDFTTVVNEIVLVWARSERFDEREAAALALGVMAYDDRMTSQVLTLLQRWSRLGAWTRLCAAGAYSGLVGARYPAIALRQLCMLTQVERVDIRLARQVVRSVVSLFNHQTQNAEHALKVLEALLLWTEAPGIGWAIVTGLTAFLRIAEYARVEAVPQEGSWPALLWLLTKEGDSSGECGKRIVTLWRRAITNRLTSRLALRHVLRQWLRTVDRDARLYTPFEHLVKSLAAGDEDDYERIEAWLESRVEDPKDKDASAVAQKLLIMVAR